MFTKTATATILAGLSAVAFTTAAPTPPIYPPLSTSNYFQLVANVSGADLSPSIQNWVVQSYHTGAGTSVAVLGDPKTAHAGSLPSFYVNGTVAEVRFGQSGVVMDTGDSLIPMSIQATQNNPDSEGRYPIDINVGLATTNVGFKGVPEPIPYAYGPGYSGQNYYACQAELEWGSAVGLYFQWAGQSIPEGCVPVLLLPQCSTGRGATHDDLQAARCYTDIASIDWPLYGAPW